MKENPMIVPVTLRDAGVKNDSGSQMNQERPVCHLKIKDAEVDRLQLIRQFFRSCRMITNND